MVKVPQISAIARAGSARGLSCLAFELEQLGLSVNAANGFVRGLPFSAYGEALVLLAQNTVLLGQIYALSGVRGARPTLVAALFLGGGAAVLAGACARAGSIVGLEGARGCAFESLPCVRASVWSPRKHLPA